MPFVLVFFYTRSAQEPVTTLAACRDVTYSKLADGVPVHVDLHMRLRPYGRGDVLAARILREGMSAENLLLYICLNLLVHRFARLRHFVDLVSYLRDRQFQWDWEGVTRRAQSLEWSAGAFYCFLWASQLDSTLVPAHVLNALRPPRMTRLWVETVTPRHFPDLIAKHEQLEGPLGTLALLGCESGWRAKFRLAAAILFPPGATLRQMDVPTRPMNLPRHFLDRLARKTRSLAGSIFPG